MLQTLRIWKWTAMVDQDYNDNLYKNLIDNWPWRTPWSRLSSWKYSYNTWGVREFLKFRKGNLLNAIEWYIPTKRTKRFRREVRMTYLRSAIWTKESLARYYEEKANETNADIS